MRQKPFTIKQNTALSQQSQVRQSVLSGISPDLLLTEMARVTMAGKAAAAPIDIPELPNRVRKKLVRT